MTKDTAFKLLLKEKAARAKITDTATYARNYRRSVPAIKEKIYTINWFTRLIFLALGTISLFFAGYAFDRCFIHPGPKKSELYAGIILLLLFLLTAAMFLYNSFAKNKIKITTAGIGLNKRSHLWADVHETYILEEPGFKNTQYQLILTLKDGSIIRHPLRMYNDIYASLAAHIQYFKQRSVQ
jgi:hypothetical protein